MPHVAHNQLIIWNAILTVLILLLSMLVIILFSRKNRYARSYLQHDQNVGSAQISDDNKEFYALKADLDRTFSRMAIVRYNPFDDTGSDLSFSLVMLNNHIDGVVLTSLWGREEVRVYAKPIKSGLSDYPLSPEEHKALEQAKNQ